MIKKVMIMALLSVFSIFILNQTMHTEASFTEEPAVNTGGLWHVENGNRAYVHMRYTDGSTVIETGDRTNDNFPEYDYSQYTYWKNGSENDFSFPNRPFTKTTFIENPDPLVYDTFNVEIIANMLGSFVTPSFKTIESYTSEVVNMVTIDLHDWADRPLQGPETYYNYDYSYITLEVDGTEILTSRNVSQDVSDAVGLPVNPNYSDIGFGFGVRMYWEKTSTEEVIDPNTSTAPWSLLPITSGNPTNPVGDWGTVSNMNVVGQSVSFDIEYSGVTYPVTQFTVDGNLDFIDKANDVLYFTDPDTEDRILYFNFGETLDSAILSATSFNDVNVWKGEALWNLSQNEIKVTDVLKVYNYIPDADEDGNVYSYFYMPDVPVDELISVSSVLAYRYWSDGFLWTDPSPGDIQYKVVAAVRGETTSVNPTWVEDTYKTAYIAGGFSAGLLGGLVIGGTAVPVVGWAVPAAFFLVGGTLQIADANEYFAYDVDQLQHVIPDATLTNQINSFIAESSGQDTFSADTDKLYKLHLATLQEGDEVEIMDELSNVTQVVWETDGQIYVVNEENIDDTWGGPGTLIPQTSNPFDIPEELVWAAIGIGAFYIFAKLDLGKKPGLLLLLLGVLAYYLYKMGLI